MGNRVDSFRKDIALRSIPALAGIICVVVAFRMASPSHATFVLLVSEGLALLALAAFLVRRYLRTPE